MPQHDRNQSFPRSGRGGRMTGGMDRDRYASGNERRYSPSWDEHPGRGGYEGDRTYAAGGYEEEFGTRRRGSRDLERGQGQRGGDYGAEREWERDPRRQWRGPNERGRADRYESRRDDYRRETRQPRGGEHLMHWDSLNDRGGAYFGTGSYYGAFGTQPGSPASGADFGDPGRPPQTESRSWDEYRDEGADAYGGSSGDYDAYGRSRFGAQSGYARSYGPARGTQRGYGQDYRERFAEERYGREPEYGYGFGQSPYKSEAGRFRGRGPKGYERSDERLREIVCERLTDEPSIDASDVSIEVKDKIVKLTGFVSDRRTKHEIEDLIEGCGGVRDIDNQIRVRAAGV